MKILSLADELKRKVAQLEEKNTDVLGTTINEVQLTDNFNLYEFQCRHCAAVRIHPELVRRLQAMRDELGGWIAVRSGYRCDFHNRAVGGASNSQHTIGTAADIRAADMAKLTELAEKYFRDGGLGTSYTNHIHVDVRGKRSRW